MTAAAWRAYLALYRGAGPTIAATTGAVALQAAFGLPIAALLRRLLDGGERGWWVPALSAGGIVLLYLAGDALLLFAVHRNLALVKQAVTRLRVGAVTALARVRVGLAPAHATGVLHAALVHDTERVDEMSAALLCRLLPAALSLLVLFGVLAALNPVLFAVTLATFPLAWAATVGMRRRVRARIAAVHASQESYGAGVLATLQQMDFAVLHGAERQALDRHARLADGLRDSGHAVAWIATALGVAQNEVAVFTALAIVLVGHAMVAAGHLTLGTLLAFYVVLAMTRSHLSALATQLPSVVAGGAALVRLHRLVAEALPPAYSGTRPVAFTGAVRLAGVAHGHGGALLFRDLDLRLVPGRVQALAGPNGAGKTSLVRLVLGLDRPVAGALWADDVPYDELDVAALRRGIGFVPQDPLLFAGSLRDNLVFGLDAPPADEAVARALDMAGAGFVAGLDAGLESWLGDGGVRLSGGQRQRLSLARAFLRSPALLILDEPTNHLGTADALAILARFRAAHLDSAVLLVSHDPALLAVAHGVCRLGDADTRVDTCAAAQATPA